MFRQIQEELIKQLRKVGINNPSDFSVPPKSEMGDVAFPCFSIAKASGKKPNEVANELALKITAGGVIEKVQAFGPYVNFFLNSEKITELVINEVLKKKNKFGSTTVGRGKKILLEYPSNNTHKEFHIGHFRNVCIGNPLVQLYQKAGYKVYPVNYLNDFGAHVARCLWGLLKFHKGEKTTDNKQKWLGQIYAEASRYLKDHPEEAVEVAEIQKQLEAHDKKIWSIFLETREWSIEGIEDIFKDLKVKHVTTFFEKDIKHKGQKIVDELLKKKIAKVGEGGAIIVDLSEYGLDVALLRKSNGVGLYLTADIPLAEEKFKKFKVDESIVITGQEQSFYFKQLYKILELMGVKRKLTHLSYGLVNLPEGKMSSRTGNVILYEDLFETVKEKMVNETKERHPDWSEKKILKVATTLTLAALKFDIQKHEAIKNIVFDINEATSVEGFSGPYLLYVVARINSLLTKAKKEKIKTTTTKGLVSAEEKRLVMMMGEMQEVLNKALANYNPSTIARYAFEVAQAFNDFYNKHSVVGAETKELAGARLVLSLSVKQVLTNLLDILTIDTVEEM